MGINVTSWINNLKQYMGRRDNPSGLTAADVGTYTKSQYNNMQGSNISAVAFPISRYGSLNYLPAAVTGSFEGSSRDLSSSRFPMAVEDDGSVVLLRSGVVGSKTKLFYSYVTYTENGSKLSYVNSTKAYTAPLKLGHEHGLRVENMSEDCFIGTQYNTSEGNKPYVVILNGTMDESSHYGAYLDSTYFVNRISTAIIIGDYLYLFRLDNFVTMYYGRVLLSDIKTKDEVTVERSFWGGWQVTGINKTSTAEVGQGLNLAAKSIGTDAEDCIMTNTGGTSGNLMHSNHRLQAALHPGGKEVRFVLSSTTWRTKTPHSRMGFIAMSYVMNLPEKTLKVDPHFIGKKSNYGFTTSITFSGPMFSSRDPLELQGNGNGTCATIHSQTGMLYSAWGGGSSNIYYRNQQCANWTSKFDALQIPYKGLTDVRRYITISDVYGSELGGQLGHCYFLSENTLLVRSDKGDKHITYDPNKIQTFERVDGSSMEGFAPTVDRRSNSIPYPIMTEHVKDDPSATKAHIAILADSFPSRNNVDLSAEGTLSGITVSMDNALLEAKALELLEANGFTKGDNDLVRYALYLPSDTRCCAFISVGLLIRDVNISKMFWSPVEVNTRRGHVNSVTLLGTATDYKNIQVSNAVNIGGNYFGGRCTVWHNRDENFFFVSFTMPASFNYIGNTCLTGANFICSDNGVPVAGENWTTRNYAYHTGSYHWTTIPQFGPGYITSLNKNKNLAFRKAVGTTRAELKTQYIAPSNTYFSILSNEVVEGWVVYFSERTPLFLGGKSYQMEPTNIDLRNVDPSHKNSTFYVFVEVVNNVAQYTIVKNKALKPSTPTCMYLGYITTGAEGISEIRVSKLTRVGLKSLKELQNFATVTRNITVNNSDIKASDPYYLNVRLSLKDAPEGEDTIAVNYHTEDGTAKSNGGTVKNVAYDSFGNPFISAMDNSDNGGGRLVLDGGFPKFYSSGYSQASDTWKYFGNAVKWIEDSSKGKKILLLGDQKDGKSYSLRTHFTGGFTSWCNDNGYTLDSKIADEFGPGLVTIPLDLLNQYCMVVVMSSASDGNRFTDATAVNFKSYSVGGGGIFIITDHDVFQPSGNKILTQFGANFFGTVNRSPMAVSELISKYGNHPLWDGLTTIQAGSSEGNVDISEALNTSPDFKPLNDSFTFAAGENEDDITLKLYYKPRTEDITFKLVLDDGIGYSQGSANETLITIKKD